MMTFFLYLRHALFLPKYTYTYNTTNTHSGAITLPKNYCAHNVENDWITSMGARYWHVGLIN